MLSPQNRLLFIHITLHGICENLQSFLQSYNKSLINQACSGPHWENIGPRSFLYGPRYARSVLSGPRADILPVRPSRLVNKIYVFAMVYALEIGLKISGLLGRCIVTATTLNAFFLPELIRKFFT